MRTIACFCFIVAVSPLSIASKESAGHKSIDDRNALQGEWLPLKAELAGKLMPEAVLKTISLKLTKNEYEVLVAGKPDKGTWTVDPTAKPKGIAQKRPTEFKTKPDTKLYLVTYKRKKG